MGFLDNSTVTVDAILTKKGRQILSQGGNFNITKFALSDEEVDYTLYDVTHPNGTDSYGAAIENISVLEASPNRTTFNSFLVDNSLAGVQLTVTQKSYTGVDANTPIPLKPETIGGDAESYNYVIGNTNIVKFEDQVGNIKQAASGEVVNLKAQSITVKATTTVTITGLTSGLTEVVSITVEADATSNNDPNAPKDPTDETATSSGINYTT